MWVIIAFLNPLFHALSNVLDNYLTNRLFSRKTTIIFYAVVLNLACLPVLFIFTGLPKPLSPASFELFAVLALINVCYQYPYYKALEKSDTSNVVALFALGQLFVPIFAYFIVHEVLAPIQYLGVFIIMCASIGISYEPKARFQLNASFWWMLLCTFILAIEYVLYKLVFISTDWITGFSWPLILSFVITLGFLLVPSLRRDIVRQRGTVLRQLPVFGAEEATTFIGSAAGTYAISVAPVTVVKAIMSVEPAFVLLYAVLFGKTLPKLFKEETDRRSIVRKLFLFVCIGIGLVLTLSHLA